MIILPSQHSHLLPTTYRKLMTDDESNIIDLFPTEVKLDYLNKDMFWQCEPKLPIIDIERILNETKELKISSNSNKRNQELETFVF
jgi:5'-3' exoribonuclease 2